MSGFLSWFQWVNPEADLAEKREIGYLVNSEAVGVLPRFDNGIYAILCERPGFSYWYEVNKWKIRGRRNRKLRRISKRLS